MSANNEIAAIFNEIADILDIKGENAFRIIKFLTALQIMAHFNKKRKLIQT